MGTTLEPIMEPVHVPGSISGVGVIDDLLNRIGERLSRSDCLRLVDSYKSYNARVVVELQLIDIDMTEVNTEVAVGGFHPTLPVKRIALGESVAADEVGEAPPPLERLPDGEVPVPVKPSSKRDYSRSRSPSTGRFL